jgi:hypothetical protein
MNQNFQTHSAINKCIDFFLPYRKKDLDESFLKENKKILAQKRGVGYWLWKPYLILKTLEKIPENDFIIYLDSGASLNKTIDGLINQLQPNQDIIVFENYHINKPYTKRDLLKAFNMDNKKYREKIALAAGFISIRNTEFSRNFIREWFEWCRKEELLTDSPSANEYPEFLDHRHDQAILGLMYLKNQESAFKDKIILKPSSAVSDFFFLHKRRSQNSYSLFRIVNLYKWYQW